jgi:mono/diheme cytochrome c family protein
MGVIYAPNLTPGGPLKDWTDGEILRAIREGVDKDSRPLIIMPSQAMHSMSDADAAAMVAYLRSQPEIKRDLPNRDLNALAAVFLGAGMFSTSAQTPINAPIVSPKPGTLDYGKYLVAATGCKDCHGPDLTGSSGGPAGSAPNLTMLVPTWQESGFMSVFNQGIEPGGRKLSDHMPWKSYRAAFSDEELRDIYNYLHSIPQIETSVK